MRTVGYLRVSKTDQLLDRQVAALAPLCDQLYVEKLSAVAKRRPCYDKAVRSLRRGDVLVVLDTDRAYRCARDALNELYRLERRGIAFRAINFPADTTTPEGRFALTVTLAANQLEREVLARRTREGLAAARRRGKILGRPRKLSDAQVRQARERLARRDCTKTALAAQLEVGRWTLTRALSRPQ